MSDQEEIKPSLARGDELNADTWADFVSRLHHDCVGAGVRDHFTANAIFIVEARRLTYGIDRDYSDKLVVIHDDLEHFSPQEYWDDLDEEERAELDKAAQEHGDCDFLELHEDDRWEVLSELKDHAVTGWDERWEYVNSHFTKDAAEAFVWRKNHDYPKGLRVYVDAQSYCWEFNAIKEAILKGRLVLDDERDQLRAEVEALRQFANKIISGTLAGGSFDGGDIQEMAVQHGLLRSEQRNEPCGDVCNCSEFGFPCQCFRKTALLLGTTMITKE